MDHQDADMQIEDVVNLEATQPASQYEEAESHMDGHIWGALTPCSPTLPQVDFWKTTMEYNVGRDPACMIFLPGFKVSQRHCLIKWDGDLTRHSAVTVLDLSSNGTFINGLKIGKNNSGLLRDGNEICFGTMHQQSSANEDYRYIYRHKANVGGSPQGVHEDYEISHELGKGSFATVMKAVHRSTGTWYAVKMIKSVKLLGGVNSARNIGQEFVPAAISSESPAQAFAREISIMETLYHPNICQLKETFWGTTTIDLVLEYIDGGDLLSYILSSDGVSEEDTQFITYQICDAMQYIHSKNIAHRDLKPENILLTSAEPRTVKIADFGLAKAADSFTMLKTMCGTPSYLAPEVVLQTPGAGYDHLVDSWSVGVIVFSMLTNAGPFVEDDKMEIKARVRAREIDWDILLECELSQLGYDFIGALMQYEPEHRMSLADAFLHRWLVKNRPPSDGEPPRHGTEPLGGSGDTAMITESDVSEQSFGAGSSMAASSPGAGSSTGGGGVRGSLSQLYLEGSRHPEKRSLGFQFPVDVQLDLVPSLAPTTTTKRGAAATKGKAKRLHSQLSNSDVMDTSPNAGVLVDGVNVNTNNKAPRKKGKVASPAKSNAANAKGKMGPPALPAGRAGRKEDEMMETTEDAVEAPKLRRSTRAPAAKGVKR